MTETIACVLADNRYNIRNALTATLFGGSYGRELYFALVAEVDEEPEDDVIEVHVWVGVKGFDYRNGERILDDNASDTEWLEVNVHEFDREKVKKELIELAEYYLYNKATCDYYDDDEEFQELCEEAFSKSDEELDKMIEKWADKVVNYVAQVIHSVKQ
jgi:hypothetical protein